MKESRRLPLWGMRGEELGIEPSDAPSFVRCSVRAMPESSEGAPESVRAAGMEGGGREPDAFDAIVMAETRFHGEGYQEGYAEGIHAGITEGRQYGVQQGTNIGLEIGSYLGFALTWKKLLHTGSDEKHSRKTKVLESLIEMIEKFPREDPVYERLQEDLEKIRGRFKQACSLLHIPSDARLGSGGSALTF